MAKYRALYLYPKTLRLNGESGNLQALDYRLEARGASLEIVNCELGEQLPGKRPDFVFLGSGTLTATKLASEDLRIKSAQIRAWIKAGTKVLAVGSGFDLVSNGLETAEGETLFGLGLTDTRHRIGAKHLVGEVVATNGISGFVNSNRVISRPSSEHALATVSASDETELVNYVDGFKDGTVLASNIQGPLLPMNPELADEFLGWVIGSEVAASNLDVDVLSAKARASISNRVGN